MKKTFIFEYSTKCKKGSRDYTKVVETDNVEEYIKKNFVFGYSYRRGVKMFHCAKEVIKNGLHYDVVKGGEYYSVKMDTLFDGELRKSENWEDNLYYNSDLKAFYKMNIS